MKKVLWMSLVIGFTASCGFVDSWFTNKTINDADKAAVFGINDLNPLLAKKVPLDGDTFNKRVRGGKGQIEYRYEYRPNAKEIPLVVNTMIFLTEDAQAGAAEYLAQKENFNQAFPYEIKTLAHQTGWGKQEMFALLKGKDGDKMGNYYIGHKKGLVYFVAIFGRYFEKPETLTKILIEKLKIAETNYGKGS